MVEEGDSPRSARSRGQRPVAEAAAGSPDRLQPTTRRPGARNRPAASLDQPIRQVHVPSDERLPTPESLRLSISENWQHARHAQELRDRLNNLYWISWGAVLAFMHVTTTGSNPASTSREERGLIFGLLALLSALVLSSTLKWTSEFANHVAAVYHGSLALGLVVPKEGAETKGWLDQIRHGGASLPYPPFRGYMALPLNMPIFLNVGAAISMILSLGLAVSTGLCLQALFGDSAGAVGGVVALVAAIIVGAWVVQLTDSGIRERAPHPPTNARA